MCLRIRDLLIICHCSFLSVIAIVKTKICQQCNQPFELFVMIGNKMRCIYNRRYCLVCSPFGQRTKNRKALINGQRECLGCHTLRPLDNFGHYKGGRLRSYCYPCDHKRIKDYGQLLKRKAVDYLGGKCCICGYSKSLRSLNFHHTDPTQKEFSIAKRKCLNWTDTQQELDKCVLVCANCHGEIHDNITQIPMSVSTKRPSPQPHPISSDTHQTINA